MKIYHWKKGVKTNWRHLYYFGQKTASPIVSIHNKNKKGRRKAMLKFWLKHQFGIGK